jgi:hypothetical protein
MRVPDVYPILCDKLRALQALPYAKLQEMIDVMPTSIPIDIMNEAITIEVRVEWTDQRKRGMRITATAFGSSCFRMERTSESVLVEPD